MSWSGRWVGSRVAACMAGWLVCEHGVPQHGTAWHVIAWGSHGAQWHWFALKATPCLCWPPTVAVLAQCDPQPAAVWRGRAGLTLRPGI